MPSPSELRALAERAKELAGEAHETCTHADAIFSGSGIQPCVTVSTGFIKLLAAQLCDGADALLDLLAENERLRTENEKLRGHRDTSTLRSITETTR